MESSKKNQLIAKFVLKTQRAYTPISELKINEKYQILGFEKKELQHGMALIATLSDERIVILPKRFLDLATDEFINAVSNNEGKLFCTFRGVIRRGSKNINDVVFCDE